MEQIKGTVEALLAQLKEKSQKSEFSKGGPEALLKKVFTKKELAHINFGYFRNGTLGIKVESSSWLYYFNIKKEDLLGRVRRQSSTVKDMRFSIGEWDKG